MTRTLRQQVLTAAAWALRQRPVTITAASCPRSAGGLHDFYSEGDYWWPVQGAPDSPYIQRDGMTNPDNFTDHRKAMIRLSRIVGALASAYRLTGDEKYVTAALEHCRAWFVDTATRMNPSLQFAQAIKGRAKGRGIGIIDTIHFIEVVQGLLVMEEARSMDRPLLINIRRWFDRYLDWLTTSSNGRDEMNALNNHGTCWTMQVAAFAKFTGNKTWMDFCRDRYKNILLPAQMAPDGSFPLELKRTKPYGYSIFNLDAMTTLCGILSTQEDDLWHYQTPDGRSIRKGIEFLYPYIADKSKWPNAPDVMYWKEWPVAQPFLFFGAMVFGQKDWLDAWTKLDHAPLNEEVIRNLPVRHPLIWFSPVAPGHPAAAPLDGLSLKPHSSIDRQEFTRQYHLNQHYWDEAFDFLRTHDLPNLARGKYIVDTNNVFVSVTEDSTRDFDKTNWESHRKYIDIICVIKGEERIGICPVEKATVTRPYDEKKESANYSADGKYYDIPAGTFVIFFPADAHRPNITTGGNQPVKVVVVKVRAG